MDATHNLIEEWKQSTLTDIIMVPTGRQDNLFGSSSVQAGCPVGYEEIFTREWQGISVDCKVKINYVDCDPEYAAKPVVQSTIPGYKVCA